MYVKSEQVEPSKLYGFLNGLVVPRPIAWIGSVDQQGVANLAPFSFYNVASIQPPVLSIAILNRPDGSHKDSLKNIKASQCFSVSVTSRQHSKAVLDSSDDYPPEVDEFAEIGLTQKACQGIDSVCVQEALAVIECTLREVIHFGPEGQAVAGNLVLGNIVGIDMDESVLSEKGRVDLEALDAIGRLSGPYYAGIRDRFEMGS